MYTIYIFLGRYEKKIQKLQLQLMSINVNKYYKN